MTWDLRFHFDFSDFAELFRFPMLRFVILQYGLTVDLHGHKLVKKYYCKTCCYELLVYSVYNSNNQELVRALVQAGI